MDLYGLGHPWVVANNGTVVFGDQGQTHGRVQCHGVHQVLHVAAVALVVLVVGPEFRHGASLLAIDLHDTAVSAPHPCMVRW